jgi:hypothetical protein
MQELWRDQLRGGIAMCCNVPHSSSEPIPKQPWWQVYVQLYREIFCGARWYDVHTSSNLNRRVTMDFDQYVAEIQKLAETCGATDPGKPYCEAEAWRGSFNDGLTPAEAWSEEVSAAASMIG